MSAQVIAIKPYIASVPVCVELLLVTMEITLCFGPFNSHEEGKHWVAAFELARADIEAVNAIAIEGTFVDATLSTRPFVDAYTYVCDVLEAGPDARKPDAVIPSGDPQTTAKHIRIFALRALEEAVAFGLAHVEAEG
jgi:hypothetical protein